MSATTAAVLQGAEQQERLQPGGGPTLPDWFLRLTPKQGWDSFIVLALLVVLPAWTVTDAAWVKTPGLWIIALLSCLVGLLLARVRAPWPLLILGGLAVGLLVVVGQASAIAEGSSPGVRIGDLFRRIDLWYQAATSGGISTDLLPFTTLVMSLAWLLGLLSAWFLFRRSNVWVGVVLSGTALLTTLSFLPASFTLRFFFFVFLAMLIVARVTMLQRQERWSKASIRFSPGGWWMTLRATAGLSAVVLLLAALIPLRVYVSQTAIDAWNVGRSPIQNLEDQFARLLGGLPSRTNQHGRFFGKTLPFKGKISFAGDIVIWARAERPTYWQSQTYSEYTSQGWVAGETSKQRVGPESVPPPAQESLERVGVENSIQLTFASYNMFTGGNVDRLSHESVVETLRPLRFEIDLREPSRNADLPEDLQLLAQRLAQDETLFQGDALRAQGAISPNLPDDLHLIAISPVDGGQQLGGITVRRKDPEVPDVVSFEFGKRLQENEVYHMRSYLSEATTEQLREAGTDYGGFIKDHYLQLPSTFPQRVRDMAVSLTQNAETPVDKAVAIREFLRGDTYTYSQDIQKPPPGSDGVEHFLFESGQGYSDYFASSMAVMLRAVGVPARMVAGYAPGELHEESGLNAVKDSDSHGWTQVYFPKYGWIDFEPTPNWPVAFQRGSIEIEAGEVESVPAAAADQATAECQEALDALGVDDPVILLEECEDVVQPELGNLDLPLAQEGWDPTVVARPLGIALGAVLVIALTAWGIWERSLAKATPSERAYIGMNRFGFLAGIRRRPDQTPTEYATAVAGAVPRAAGAAQAIAMTFGVGRYAGREPSGDELDQLSSAWKGVRNGLLGRMFTRLVPAG